MSDQGEYEYARRVVMRPGDFSASVMQPKRAWMDELRNRIDAENAVRQLNASVAGEVNLTNNQMRSVEVALRKTLPDLSAVAIHGAGQNIAVFIGLDSPQDTIEHDPV